LSVCCELLKYAEAPISRTLHDLFSIVWSSGKVPAEWKGGIRVSLYEGKGSRSSCNNYRNHCDFRMFKILKNLWTDLIVDNG